MWLFDFDWNDDSISMRNLVDSIRFLLVVVADANVDKWDALFDNID